MNRGLRTKGLGRRRSGESSGWSDNLEKSRTGSTVRIVLVDESVSLRSIRFLKKRRTTPRNGGSDGKSEPTLSSLAGETDVPCKGEKRTFFPEKL